MHTVMMIGIKTTQYLFSFHNATRIKVSIDLLVLCSQNRFGLCVQYNLNNVYKSNL